EETLDEIAVAIEEGAEGRDVLAVGHRLDVGPRTAPGEIVAQPVGVIAAVGQQDLPRPETPEHVSGALAVVRLTFGQLYHHGPALSIDERVDLGRQTAARAPHASGVSSVPNDGVLGAFFGRPPFELAACWCTRTEELSIICRPPS